MLLCQSISASPPSSALLPSPHLFDSQGQGDPLYNGTPFITAGTITGDISLSENFKPVLPPVSLSLYLSPSCSLALSFFSCPAAIPSFFSLPPLCLFAWLPMSSIAGQTPISPSPSLQITAQRRWSTVFYLI